LALGGFFGSLEYLTEKQKDDEILFKKIIINNSNRWFFSYIRYASERLKNDLDFLILAAQHDLNKYDSGEKYYLSKRNDLGSLFPTLEIKSNLSLAKNLVRYRRILDTQRKKDFLKKSTKLLEMFSEPCRKIYNYETNKDKLKY
jgi:hypothetical protein